MQELCCTSTCVDVVARDSCYDVELNGYVVEHSRSKGQLNNRETLRPRGSLSVAILIVRKTFEVETYVDLTIIICT